MKKVVVLLFLLFCIGVGLFFGFRTSLGQKAQLSTSKTPISQSSQTPPQDQPAVPIKLSIPKIGVNAVIESVGQDSLGRMDVPKDPQDTGWYSLGYKPGEKGSAVVDGHLDTVTGAPAAFWSLSKLQPGDTIHITDKKNHTYTFVVNNTFTYDYDKVPMQKVFASNDKPRLNLITCRGIFDKKTKNYSKRIVVYAEKK